MSEDYRRLELSLLQYIAIVQPLVCSLWALESSQANASDVYIFALAIGASLRELFDLGHVKTVSRPHLTSRDPARALAGRSIDTSLKGTRTREKRRARLVVGGG